MPSQHRHADIWFTIGLGLIGAATGYFVALSRSPIAGIVLPLIFGLVGGAGGVYIAKADLTSEQSQRRLALIGKAVGALSLSMMAATGITIATRNESIYQPLIGITGVQQLNTRDLLALIQLRAQLQSLGASVDEQKSVLSRAAKADVKVADPAPVVAKKLRSISNAAVDVLEALKTPFSAEDQKTESYKSVLNLQLWLSGINPVVRKWADDLDAKSDVPQEEIDLGLQLMEKALVPVVGSSSQPSEVLTPLASYPKLAQSLMSLRMTLSAESPRLKETVKSELSNFPDDQFKFDIAEPLRPQVPSIAIAKGPFN